MNQVLPFGRKVLALLFLFCWVSASATDPTISASNVTFPASQIDGGQFQVSFTGGNGTGRIVVVKEGSDITGVPQDFTRYTTNPAFGTAGSEFTAPGEYVVAYTTSVSSAITVTNLKAGTTYYVAIFEFNGNYNVPSTIDYSAVTPTGKLVTTDSAPSTQATITGFSLVAGTSLRVHYTNGNGTGRMVVVKKGTTITALPVDLTQYNYSSVFKSTAAGSYYLDAETFIVLKWNTTSPGTADYAYVSGLEPNSTYTFAVFEYNSSVSAVSPVFLRPGTQMTVTTNAGPTLASSGITSGTPDGNRLNPYWANGNGARRLVIAKKGSAVTSAPVNGNRYTANAQFGMGAEIVAGSNEYVVYDGVSNGLTVTNLEKATGYHFAVYEFDMDANGYAYYLTSSHASATISTAAAPTNNLTLTVSNITGSSAKLNYTFPSSGYGNSRMSVIRDSFPVDFLPVDLTAYSGNTSTYGGGALVAPGTYTLAGQTNGGAPTVTGLTPGHTYYVTIFEMNGTTAPVYLTPGASVSFTIPNEPTAASTNPVFSSIEGNSIRFDWINGNGARRIVVARKGSAVSSVPQDGITYTAAAFGSGTELVAGSGEFVVYDGTFNSVTISNLEKATTYHFAVFEYNPSATGPDYLNAAGKWLAASKATASAPATQTSNLSASNIQLNQATISFTGGSGAGRIFVMREGSPVDAEPLDFVNYNFSAVFGNVQLGTGNFIVAKSVGNFTVTNLKPGTQYYITAFEYNGNSAPVFLRPGAVMYSFTTSGGIVAPTLPAQSPLFDAVDGNKFSFKWTNGNGAGRIVVARKNSAVDFVPADAVTYPANASFGNGPDLGGGQFVVYNGTGTLLALTNLEAATTYHFAVYEYNGSGSTSKYLTTALSASGSTVTAPAIISSNPITAPAASSIVLSWTNGNGSGRIVIAKEGSAVTASPVNLNAYSANAIFGNGPQVAVGEYVVYAGAGSSVTVTGLTANKTYHFSVFEYNGYDAPVYNTGNALTASATVLSALPVTWLYVNAAETNGKTVVNWATAQEINTEYYLVEKSSNGIDYSEIARVKAAGNSNQENHYSYTDKMNSSASAYYRIRQVDADNKYTYSSVVRISGALTQKIKLLQNPVQGQVRIQCAGEHMGATLRIVDVSGRELCRAKILSPLTTISTGHLKAGVYYIVFCDKSGAIETIPLINL